MRKSYTPVRLLDDSISGLLQVNVKIPHSTASGLSVPILLSVGTIQGPSNVTLAVR